MQKTEFKTRPPRASDLNFIFSSFSKCMKRESDIGRSTRSIIFFTEFQKVIDHLLNNCTILIACSPEEENAIMGYLVFEGPHTIHFAWVRPSCRRKEIAKCLIHEAFPHNPHALEYSLNTNDSKKISKDRPELIHNPFVLYKKEL